MENWNNLNNLLDINSKSVKRKEEEALALIEYAQKGEKENIRKMLKSGATINCFADNSTPLISCIETENFDLAVYLLSVRASISYKGAENHDDALWYSIKNQKHKFLSLFIMNRCLLTLDYESRFPALIYSTTKSDLKAVEELLKHYKINVNERDGAGNTALHHNVSKDSPSSEDLEIGKLLVAAGADINARNLDGKTAEEAAVDFSSRSMLLSSKMERELENKAENEPEVTPEVTPEDSPEPEVQLSKTRSNKIKI